MEKTGARERAMSDVATGLSTWQVSAATLPPYGLDLARDLRAGIRGEVRFDRGSRAAYSTDASNYRQVPIGVVLPVDAADLIATLRICRLHGAPITPRGGGTSLAGQTCNEAVIVDCSKYMNRVLEVDPQRRTARVQPGVVLDDLRDAAGEHGLTFPPDPATHSHCTIAGMIGNNSCGIHSVMGQYYGLGVRTEDYIASLDVVTYDGIRLTLCAMDEEELEAASRSAGREGEIYSRLRSLRDRYREEIRSRFPDIPRRVSGYNLPALLTEEGVDAARAIAGSEGTCVMILEATVKLVPQLPERALVVLGYPDIFSAADHVTEVMGTRPVGVEGMDDTLVGYMKRKGLHPHDVDLLPEGGGWLLVEYGADSQEEALRRARELAERFSEREDAPSVRVYEEQWEARKLWDVRESGLGATAHIPDMPTTNPGWEDVGIPPERLGDYLREFRSLLTDFGYHAALYGHFGQGCVHCRIDFGLDSAPAVRKFTAFLERAAQLVLDYGGSFSGEHGDGQARGPLLEKMFGGELMEAFREFKRIWDPDWRMNPGKLIDSYRADQNLRMGPAYEPLQVSTHFSFLQDQGSFADAVTRCVGVGKCRRGDGGVMCPSYMVTLEEEHSTRGRSRLLFEMLNGDELRGLRDTRVKEALDLCLSCKACKNECPVNVDMATYKSEFLAHYYRYHRRPRSAFSMGLIYWWARLASLMPGLANIVTQTPLLSSLAKSVGGIAQERELPPFARRNFRQWFRDTGRDRYQQDREGVPLVSSHAGALGSRTDGQRRAGGTGHVRHEEVPRFRSDTYDQDPGAAIVNADSAQQPFLGQTVMLWPDTFNNFFTPEVAVDATLLLEKWGYRVVLPPRSLCCGRPLYEFGMLDTAKRLWRRTLETLRPYIRAGIPIVGLEPSCITAFRDELPGLFPHDMDARRLARLAYLFSEFIERQDIELPRLGKKALVHAHCHHQSVIRLDAEIACLKKLGLDYDVLESGCCGMAGSFGFESEKYEVSMRAGERVLLPAVRSAGPETLIIANGFSCKQQIAQGTDRRALHLAQVVSLAMRSEGGTAYPEDSLAGQEVEQGIAPLTLLLCASTVGFGAGLLAARVQRRRSVAHGRPDSGRDPGRRERARQAAY
ncbi:MAG TPA: FAD-binding and (Fe-S)-binding domain-containing protein [Trueperaceae bacterium]